MTLPSTGPSHGTIISTLTQGLVTTTTTIRTRKTSPCRIRWLREVIERDTDSPLWWFANEGGSDHEEAFGETVVIPAAMILLLLLIVCGLGHSMESPAGKSLISGTVTDDDGPVAGATVRLQGSTSPYSPTRQASSSSRCLPPRS